MRMATVLTPLNPHNLTLAAQCGVEDIVVRYPRWAGKTLQEMKQLIEGHGLRLAVVEGYLPMENLKLGRAGRERDLEAMKDLIRQMGEANVPVLCYHFMPTIDWLRTRFDVPERGGALVTAFDLREAQRAWLRPADQEAAPIRPISADQLWAHLEFFLKAIVPVAETHGVFLAMHPDDPPVREMQGMPRIMHAVECFEQLVRLVSSEHNGICFCQGSFATMGVNIPATIERLAKHIRYVHFRDVRGTPDHFIETFHDNGPTDMVGAMATYHKIGFKGPMREDHVPQLIGEEQGEPGYTMLGRLFAYGYMRGLMQATQRRTTVSGGASLTERSPIKRTNSTLP